MKVVHVTLTAGQRRALVRDGPVVWTTSGGETVTISAAGTCTWDAPGRGDYQQMADDYAREVLDLDVQEGVKTPG